MAARIDKVSHSKNYQKSLHLSKNGLSGRDRWRNDGILEQSPKIENRKLIEIESEIEETRQSDDEESLFSFNDITFTQNDRDVETTTETPTPTTEEEKVEANETEIKKIKNENRQGLRHMLFGNQPHSQYKTSFSPYGNNFFEDEEEQNNDDRQPPPSKKNSEKETKLPILPRPKMITIDGDECIGPNTIFSNDTCTCLPSFTFGNPNSRKGCWKCSVQCHSKAKCEFPGRCNCIKGYISDGASNCTLIPPHLVSVNPESVKIGDNSIEVKFSSLAQVFEGFCKFDTIVIVGIVKNMTMLCLIPESVTKGTKQVSISFDNLKWSNSIFVEVERPRGPLEIRFAWQVLFLILLLPFFYYTWYRVRAKYLVPDSEEQHGFKSSVPTHRSQAVDPFDNIV